MRFPEFTEPSPLAAVELEALRSLHHACNALRYEWQTTCTLVDRLSALHDMTEEYDRGERFHHHHEAVDTARRGAYLYERQLGLDAWRYASAHCVLGIAVLHRLVASGPALTDSAIDELCTEPTLGQLRAALSIPVDHLLAARDEGFRSRAAAERQKLLMHLESARAGVMALGSDKPMDEQQADACYLSENSPPDTDPMYEGFLVPLFDLSEQTPFEISQHCAARSRKAMR